MLDPAIRHRLDAYLDGKLAPPASQTSGRNLLSWIAGIKPPQDEATRLRATYALAAPTHGGLTRSQIFALIRRQQAGPVAFAPFLLFIAWCRAATDKTAFPATLLATRKYFESCFATDKSASLRKLAHAADFFQGQAPGTTHYGHAKWWQLNILTYMLSHPRPAYQIRKLSRGISRS